MWKLTGCISLWGKTIPTHDFRLLEKDGEEGIDGNKPTEETQSIDSCHETDRGKTDQNRRNSVVGDLRNRLLRSHFRAWKEGSHSVCKISIGLARVDI